MRSTVLRLLFLTTLAAPLYAQQYVRPWEYHAGVGWPAAVGSTKDAANGTFHLLFGAVRNFSPNLGLRIDAEYDRFNASGSVLDAYQARDGYANIWSLSADGQYTFGQMGSTRFYMFGGVGTHYKQAYLTEPGTGVVCDPWWGICYPVGVDVVKQKRTDTAIGANGGAGVAFPMATGASWFIEAKYQWVNTPRAGAQFIPITVGIRW